MAGAGLVSLKDSCLEECHLSLSHCSKCLHMSVPDLFAKGDHVCSPFPLATRWRLLASDGERALRSPPADWLRRGICSLDVEELNEKQLRANAARDQKWTAIHEMQRQRAAAKALEGEHRAGST
eukprot:1178735-Prorocentrum_minimum.AAC.3